MEQKVKHLFELVIKSLNSDIALKYNPTIRKWEALSSENKVLARRKNVEGLVAALNEAEVA